MAYNWEEIQSYYDSNNVTWRDLTSKFGVCQTAIAKAVKRKDFKTRSKSEALGISEKHNSRTHSDETKEKISISRKKFLIENPHMVPYILNHYSKGDSYPEKYFLECLKESTYTKKYRVGLYELDFVDLENMIDLEIDGDQHYLDKRIVDHDIKRNNFLISKGWKIIRVKWSDFQKLSRSEKETIINTIINKNYQALPSVSLFGF